MGKLIYGFNTSLDGYIEDSAGTLDWSVPDEELHKFWNSFEASIGTHLYGRKLYETMRYWRPLTKSRISRQLRSSTLGSGRQSRTSCTQRPSTRHRRGTRASSERSTSMRWPG